MKRTLIAVVVTVMGLAGANAWAAAKHEDVAERLENAGNVVHAIVDAPDKGVPEEVLDSAKCIVVVPHLVQAGFIFGGKHGRGVASCRTAHGWSAPAFVDMTGGSWGLQIGAEGIDLIMLVMNDRGLQHLLSSKFQIGGEATAAAGPVGRHASAGTDWMLNTELLTYSRAKGAFAGLTLDGTVVEPDKDATVAIYGRAIPFRTILRGSIAPPGDAAPFMTALRKAAHKAAVHEANK